MTPVPTTSFDARFSDPSAGPTPWTDALATLERAELYWLTTVRADGRPHVTPLIGALEGDSFCFCTGLREQKAHNLEHSDRVAVTTGNNTWAQGLDVVVEGRAERLLDTAALQRLADAYEAKYGSFWHFDVEDGMFVSGDNRAAVFRIVADKALAFAKDPHAQTTYRFG